MRSSPKYNCYGYALNIEEWLELDDFEGTYTKKERKRVLLNCVNELLKQWSCFNIKIESNPFEKLPENRYMIAFRIADMDFHFAKRAKNNHWYHKMGSYDIETMSISKLLNRAWHSTFREYDSDIVFFSLDVH